MKDFRLFAVMLVAALIVVAGCERQAEKVAGRERQAEKVDTSDPEAVARAFVAAAANNNVEEALQYVEPGERVNFRTEIERRGMPSIPKEPNIIVEVNGDRAGAGILNADNDFGFDLKRIDERWWIVK